MVPVEPAILAQWEMWRSLVSLLKVYAHAASMNGVPHEVIETASDAAIVVAGENQLGLGFDPIPGANSWRYARGAEAQVAWGGWQMLADGRLDVGANMMAMHEAGSRVGEDALGIVFFDLEGKVMDMDEAVIAWIARLKDPHGVKA